LSWLEESPDIAAKEMLKRLQGTGYGNFSEGQLRTLQRRVRVWRTTIARELVYGPAKTGTVIEPGGSAVFHQMA